MAGTLDPEPIRCPKCLALAGQFLLPVSRMTGQDYYECEACRHVWADPAATTPPPAPTKDVSA